MLTLHARLVISIISSKLFGAVGAFDIFTVLQNGRYVGALVKIK